MRRAVMGFGSMAARHGRDGNATQPAHQVMPGAAGDHHARVEAGYRGQELSRARRHARLMGPVSEGRQRAIEIERQERPT
jgi:hypothetical protein